MSLLGYGFYGDILKDSEKKRWMGPMRYDYSGNFCNYSIPLSVCKYVGAVGLLSPNQPSLKLVNIRNRLDFKLLVAPSILDRVM